LGIVERGGGWATQGGERKLVQEARLEESGSGLAPATDGWFVVNVRDAAWETNDCVGAMCAFEGESAPFADLGINLRVLQPGRTKLLYHAESTQEDFLVLAGQCLLLVEDEERPLTAWDFVHCPPGTGHAFVPSGATGGRTTGTHCPGRSSVQSEGEFHIKPLGAENAL
jgi:mannose-6-phosphate isomerase-like protein (cupin superfamily)